MINRPHVQAELQFPGNIAKPQKGMAVRRVQEWLSFHGHGTAIDGEFGDATATALSAFQAQKNLPATGILDQASWAALTAPLHAVLAPPGAQPNLPAMVLQVARNHLAQKPIELGGDNRGPWVRLYMTGNDGAQWPWCAGFVTFVMEQASQALGVSPPIRGSFSCDLLATQAQAANRFVPAQAGGGHWGTINPCSIFLVRRVSGDWTHTGFAISGAGDTFATIEGNTNDGGSANGFALLARTRGTASKDFIRLA